MDEAHPLQLATVDIGKLVRDVVADAQARHPDRRIEAHVRSGGAVATEVDRDKIQQLVAALVDNALTHAPDARDEVRVEAEPDQLLIVIADDGPGLTEEHASHVFTRFYRGDASRARSTGGSGLGLAIVKGIAETHGGSIDLRTSPGEGGEFAVRLPIAGAG